MSLFTKLFSTILAKDDGTTARANAYREAIHEEAKVGGTLFGPIPQGSRREFFCLDEHTWVWHEEWTDANNIRRVRTTRYDVRPQGILKAQDGAPYQPLGYEETRHFLYAVHRYDDVINQQLAPYLQAYA
jgi:hypothetical protein